METKSTSNYFSANNKIAIYGSRRQDSYLKDLASLFSQLTDSGYRLYMHEKLYSYLTEKEVDLFGIVPVENIPSSTGLVLSIGGDGTFLRAAHWVGEREIPVLGINTGHLGFLAACHLSDAARLIEKTEKGETELEKRLVLRADSKALPANAWRFALNEVTLMRDDTASMISVKANINDNFLADYRADGLIVATPTGSTAYNLSAGGPLLEPSVNCMVLSPIAPHTLTQRPLVIDGNSELHLQADCRANRFRLSLDNRTYIIETGAEVLIKKARFSIVRVKGENENFATILRDKLLWSASNP